MIHFFFDVKHIICLSILILFIHSSCVTKKIIESDQHTLIEAAEKNILQLQQSTLIFSLPSNQKKKSALSVWMNNPDIPASKKRKIQRQLDQLNTEDSLSNSLFIKAFTDHYSFSKTLFIYDYQKLILLADTHDSLSTLNQDLTLKKFVVPKHFFIVSFKTTGESSKIPLKSWYIHNSANEILKPPFPNSFSISSLKKFFRSIFSSPANELQKNYSEIAKNMDKRLNDYLQFVKESNLD